MSKLEINKKNGQILKEKLDLSELPVAIKFIKTEEDIPEGINKINEKIRHCEMVKKAAKGDKFYSTSEEQLCKGGSSAIGLEVAPEKIQTGELYYNLGRFDSLETAKKVVDSLPRIKEESYGIIYSPLEDAEFTPDSIILILNPIQGMKISQAIVYNSGKRIEANFAGIQSLCADAVAGPLTTGKPNATLGCDGSRAYANIQDDEVIYGIANKDISQVIKAFEEL